MASLDSSPLPASIVRGLTDKLVERRKGAALELERSVAMEREGEGGREGRRGGGERALSCTRA